MEYMIEIDWWKIHFQKIFKRFNQWGIYKYKLKDKKSIRKYSVFVKKLIFTI